MLQNMEKPVVNYVPSYQVSFYLEGKLTKSRKVIRRMVNAGIIANPECTDPNGYVYNVDLREHDAWIFQQKGHMEHVFAIEFANIRMQVEPI